MAETSCPKPERGHERLAKLLLEQACPGLVVCGHDDGSRPHMHDLTLRWPDRPDEAMEVTSSTVTSLERVDARLKRQGTRVAASGLTRDWFVWVTHDADVREIRAKLVDALAELEAVDVNGFSQSDSGHVGAVDQLVCRLDITSGSSRARDPNSAEEPTITLLHPISSTFIRAEAVTEVIEDHAHRPDNLTKLHNAGCAECHLLVWIDAYHPAWTGLVERPPPPTPPSLPSPITTAWAAGFGMDGRPGVLWRCRPPAAWEALTVSVEVQVGRRLKARGNGVRARLSRDPSA